MNHKMITKKTHQARINSQLEATGGFLLSDHALSDHFPVLVEVAASNCN